ncbi:GntR family transcriptional regulator [Cupriavidus sp. CuC1]|uniref:GntR family transcriptional regulator n=1 Tax=Cupriavidus sp. CuC1 TaxID=3373131 RepID=UPI0037CEF4A6
MLFSTRNPATTQQQLPFSRHQKNILFAYQKTIVVYFWQPWSIAGRDLQRKPLMTSTSVRTRPLPSEGMALSAAADPAPRTGLAIDIRATLEEEIEKGILPPGSALDERALAVRFDVSRTPVREALQQLAARELVCIAPRQCATVARLSISKVRAMLEYVGELESLCARLAARRADESLHAALDAGIHHCRQAAETGGQQAYAAANALFHEAIYAGCRNAYLAEHIRQARRRLQRYRTQDFLNRSQIARSLSDHQEIARAIQSGDELQAGAAMLLHVPAGTTGFSEFLATVPMNFFAGETSTETP